MRARRAILRAIVASLGAAGTLCAGEMLHEFVRVVDRPYERVGLTVTVTDDRGRPVRDLRREDFRVLEDDVEVHLQDFGVEGDRRDRPLSVALLLDFSESMGSQIRRVREAARTLLAGLRPEDEIMVAKFNDQVTILQPFTGDPGEPERTLRRVGRASGGTALFRAIKETLHDLRGRRGRKVILVISDGLDNDLTRSRHVLQSLYLQGLLRLCFRTQTVVYGIRPGMSPSSWLPFEGFVEETGGRLLYTGHGLDRLFARLGEEFLSQYYLAYDIDPKEREGKRRRIRIEVRRSDVVVKTMRGYFTPRTHLETMLEDLNDDDVGLRREAAYELGFVDDPRAVKGLRAALRDKEADVRLLAVEALARQRRPEAIPGLAWSLRDKVVEVREAAGDALSRFGVEAIPSLLREVEKGAGRRHARPRLLIAVRVLGEVGDDRAIAPLAGLLEKRAVATRLAAAKALGALELSEGIPALRAALEDSEREVRKAALQSIVSIAGPAASEVVEDYIRRESDPELRRAARAALKAQ